jgi:predicted nucleic acid-binding protein
MRVMLDTNVLLSMLLFPSEKMNTMMEYIFRKHELVLSSFVVDELKAVVQRKFPTKEKAIDSLLTRMSYGPFGVRSLFLGFPKHWLHI